MKDNAIAISRAIAIICMVAGHSWIASPIEKAVNLFDMSLFYVVSGYCFNPGYISNPVAFLKKRISGLWFPYVKWGVISVLLHNIFLNLGIYSVDSLGIPITVWGVTEIIKKILGCFVFGEGPDGFLGGYWFLKDMFFAVMLAYFSLVIAKGITKKATMGGVILLVLSVIKSYSNVSIPYIHTSTILSSSIFIVGYVIKQQNIVMTIARSRYRFTLFLLAIILLLFGYQLAPLSMSQLNIEVCDTSFVFPFFLYSTVTSISILTILVMFREVLNRIEITRFAIYIGNNTLTILTFHMLAFKSVNYLLCKCYTLESYTIGLFPTNLDYAAQGWWVVYTVIGVVVPISYKYILDKLFNKKTYV